MTTVTVSQKYQVVIPSEVRHRLRLRPGQKVTVLEKDGIIHLGPIRPFKRLRGIAAPIASEGIRDEGLHCSALAHRPISRSRSRLGVR